MRESVFGRSLVRLSFVRSNRFKNDERYADERTNERRFVFRSFVRSSVRPSVRSFVRPLVAIGARARSLLSFTTSFVALLFCFD